MINVEQYKKELLEKGYTIIPNVLNNEEIIKATELFFKWKKTIPDIDKIHSQINPHNIFKFHEAGHQEFAWFIRTRPKLIEIFKKIWETDELVSSFDGSCYMPKELAKKDNVWTHTDQAADSIGLKCYQSFVSLTDNKERTLRVYEGSHLLHEKYFKDRNIKDSKNWNLIEHEYLDEIKDKKRVLDVKAGDLVIWDSRTFHQNQYGMAGSEERLVQYVCYLPKKDVKNSKAMQKKREKYFMERRMTSHWPYPIKVNSLQPRTYGDKTKEIDYSKLVRPNLDDYISIIKTLI